MIKNIAHRGARSLAPENSIAAAKKAFDLGAHLWETDISVTKDEQLVLFHDDTLTRTTDVKSVFPHRSSFRLSDYTLDELKSLDLGTRFIRKDPFKEIQHGSITEKEILSLRGERIPTLEEALHFTKLNRWQVNLEMKRLPERFKEFPLPERVMETIRRVKIDPVRVIVSSFYHPWIKTITAMEPGIEIQALLGESPISRLPAWGKYTFPTYNVRSSLVDEAQIARVKAMGKGINLFTVNKEKQMIRFIRAGVDGLFTDYPQRLAALLSTGS